MDPKELKLTIFIYINDSKNYSFKIESQNIINLDDIKNKAKNDLNLTEEILLLTTSNSKNEIKCENDIITFASEDNEGNLNCDIRLYTNQKENKNENLS